MIQIALGAPYWLTRGAVYQINPRTFTSEGTIAAVTRELPFLADLGFSTIYLCPIFEADPSENRANWSIRQKASNTENPKNPYRMNDYYKIDEEYGTMDDLAACVKECHRLKKAILRHRY
jgi:glycosidase